MSRTKILIVIQGGIIQNICTSNPDVDIAVIDYDVFENDEDDDPVNVYPTENFNGNWADTIDTKNLSDHEEIVLARLKEADAEFPL